MNDSRGSWRQIPEAAYRVADDVFEQDLAIGDRDELHLALCAASPHIRLDEVERLLSAVRMMDSVAEVVRFLESTRNTIALFADD